MDGGTDAATSPGPQTAVVINFATGGEPVYCVNVTRPFQDQAHAASGREVPSGDGVQSLITLICSDSQAAGQRVFDAVSGGLQQAKQAVQAISVAAGRCAKDAADAVTAASIRAQDILSPVSAIENFYRTFVDALQAMGLPACVTLVASDESGTRVASEKYFYTE